MTKPPATAALEHPGEFWEAVHRIGNSKALERSPRIRELLLFIAQESLGGRPENLTEYEIGRAVFGRDERYVPTDDSIVRSSIRQLRRKLAEYYEAEGAADEWILELPRGSYVAKFQPRRVVIEEARTLLGAPPLHATVSGLTVAPAARTTRWVRFLMVALAVSLAGNLALLLAGGAFRLFPPPPRGTDRDRPASLTSALVMNSPEQTQLVMDDYAYVLLSRMGKQPYSLDDYIARTYTDPANARTADPHFLDLWNLLASRYLVSLGSVGAMERVLRTVPDLQKVTVRHARNLSGRDLQSGNAILFGSPPNNLWPQLYEDRLNFKLTRSGVTAEFTNHSPRPGEALRYGSPQASSLNSGPGYARLAYLPGASSRQSFVLLLTGLNMVTAEAAAEYATNPKYAQELLRLLGVSSLERIPHFELLLRTSAFDSAPKDVTPVALRTLD